MSLAQIGEFSFIIAGLGLSLGATGEFLYPVAVAVSAITTLTTPWLIRASGPVGQLRRPQAARGRCRPSSRSTGAGSSSCAGRRGARLGVRHRRLRATAPARRRVARVARDRRIARHGIGWRPFSRRGSRWTRSVARTAIVAAGALLLPCRSAPASLRVARRLGAALAEVALPAARRGRAGSRGGAAPRARRDLAAGDRAAGRAPAPGGDAARSLGGVYGPALFVLLLAALGISFWRGAADLQGHVRAGAQTIVEALVAQSRRGAGAASANAQAPAPADALRQVAEFLPGLGEPTPVELAETSPAVGRSLADLDLRGITGATVLAILRGQEGLLVPSAREVLRVGDVLALAGSHEAIDEARKLLAPAPDRAGS